MQKDLNRTIELLQNFEIDRKKLFLQVLPYIQEVIVDLLRPSEEELLSWKTSNLGRIYFRDYLSIKCKKMPNEEQISALWNYYTGNTNTRRSKSLAKLFKQINPNEQFCSYCQSDKNIVVDHKIPLVKGGVDEIKNMQYLCSPCNLMKLGKYDYLELIC